MLSALLERMTPEPNSGCWLWEGFVNPGGYAMFRNQRAHRTIYEIVHGEVPNGMVLDHICRVRSCINPDHLEVVTNTENVLRGVGVTAQNAKKANCMHGHPLSGANLKIQIREGRPRRLCRACQKAAHERFRARKHNSAIVGSAK